MRKRQIAIAMLVNWTAVTAKVTVAAARIGAVIKGDV